MQTAALPAQGTGASTDAAQASAKPTGPPTATEQVTKAVKEQLTKLAASNGKPSSAQMKQAMLDAGVAAENIEVSIDVTPTGLAVDAIEAAAKAANDCVVGQVRDGQATVAVLPVLASGRCFVGDQH